MMKYSLRILYLLCLTSAFGCGKHVAPASKLGGNYTFETECMGSELDGSVTLKVFGKGNTDRDAVEQAKKNAVRDVIFKGIHQGVSECSKSPLMLEPRALERNEAYFAQFFQDGGAYAEYVTMQDERIGDRLRGREEKIARNAVSKAIVVRILVLKLKNKLTQDGIIR
jgi:hypothetical protein